MRVCPKCGHDDHPMWRPRASRPFCEYAKTDQVEWSDPGLYDRIRKTHPDIYNDGHFVYHITKTGVNIERIEGSLFQVMGWGRDGEPEKVYHE